MSHPLQIGMVRAARMVGPAGAARLASQNAMKKLTAEHFSGFLRFTILECYEAVRIGDPRAKGISTAVKCRLVE